MFFALGEGLEEVLVEEVLENASEVVGLVEANGHIKIAYVESLQQELLMGQVLVELRCLELLKHLQCLLTNFVEVIFIIGNRLEDFVDKFLLEMFESLDGFNLPYSVLFLQKLEEPVVFALFDGNLADELHVRIDSDPEDG